MWYPNWAGTRWRSATIRNDADSIPDGVTGIFHWHNPSGPEFDSTSNWNEYQEYFLGGKGGQCVRLTLPHSCADYQKILEVSTSWSPKDIFTSKQTVSFITLVSCPIKIQRKVLSNAFVYVCTLYGQCTGYSKTKMVFREAETPSFKT
jgi:hypothetical protein